MRSLRMQLTLSVMAVALITVALISLLANVLLNRQFTEYVMEQQTARTTGIVEDISHQYNAQTQAWNEDGVYMLGMYALYDGYIIRVYDAAGNMVWDAENHDMTLCHDIMDEISQRMRQHKNSGQFISHQYALTQNGQNIGSLFISHYGPYFLSESEFTFLSALNTALAAIAVFSMLISLGVGWFLARRIARPISKTADIARQISQGNYAIRFEGQAQAKELKDLTSAINHLARALARQEHLRRQLTADVAHELRTPLATLSSHLEAMIEQVWEPTPERLASCHEEIQRLGKMVADLERLERAESGEMELAKTPLDLTQLVCGICANFEGDLAHKRLQLSIEGEPTAVCVDKDRMGGVVSNLISNAIKYTPEGGRIQIFVQDNGEESVLTVKDNGIGIPADELPFIFERFYRADKSRNRGTGGAGIGLAIVKSVVTAHGGSVIAHSQPGQGSCFMVTLPK